ncbi:MAG: helix-turn-helix domain-containing protein [Candidatus Thiodiazotropha sp. (ex Lucinoma kastoroae)]|nr:helix-turn-helix domain-containing protein [Candidatus Thiodiazotropha sp. (ex Lucinoma kastoroae)]
MTPKQIRSIRNRAGLSQASLAAIFNTHPMTISKWEREGDDHRKPDGAAVAALKMIKWATEQGLIDDVVNYLASE